MPASIVQYKKVNMRNEWMRLGYSIAKDLYAIGNWNMKTTPVAIIVSPSGKYVSHGVTADGKHAIYGTCNRLGKRGSPYSSCQWCNHYEHAEIKALNKTDACLLNHHIYIYGHYKSCDNCIKELHRRGIYKIHILENAEVLFDRHNKDTVLGSEKQFLDNL